MQEIGCVWGNPEYFFFFLSMNFQKHEEGEMGDGWGMLCEAEELYFMQLWEPFGNTKKQHGHVFSSSGSSIMDSLGEERLEDSQTVTLSRPSVFMDAGR